MTSQALPDAATIALTDDEAVALALGAGTVWPFALPTVDDTADALSGAGARGLRSLRVRDLVRSTEEGVQAHADLMAALKPVLQGRLIGAVSITDSAANAKPGTFVFAYYREGESGLLETLSSDGVHTFQSCDQETWAVIARAMADVAFRGAITEVSPSAGATDGVTLSVSDGGGARVVLVTRDHAQAGPIREGAVVLEESGDLEELLTRLGLVEPAA